MAPEQSTPELNAEAQRLWDAKASWWDEHFSDDRLPSIGLATEALLAIQSGERVLEVACGNGWLARRMASDGAQVVATDFSARFLELARQHTPAALAPRLSYVQLDATDKGQFDQLGPGRFDAAVCAMGLMDMAAIAPLFQTLVALLIPGGRFVFSVTHPAFNTLGASRVIEESDSDGGMHTIHAVKLTRYLSPRTALGTGVVGEPAPHRYFDRSFSDLLTPAFEAGLMLDVLQEVGAPLPPSGKTTRPGSWGNFPEFPLFLIARLRRPR
jgi:2-polyprenyl-3-methyl-5-hydroxy-6-metoxy-1,4-benzoquinol methylase